jgi:hypothetical protein
VIRSSRPSSPSVVFAAPKHAQDLSWRFLRIFTTFVFGGVFLSFVLDIFVSSISLFLDAIGYTSRLSEVLHQLLKFIHVSPYLLLIFAFYAKAQLVNALFALLSFVIFKRVSFRLMIVVAPFVAYGFGLSYSAEWFWSSSSVMNPWKFVALVAFQLAITLACLALARAPERAQSEPIRGNGK